MTSANVRADYIYSRELPDSRFQLRRMARALF
jgi:hypothetical protein